MQLTDDVMGPGETAAAFLAGGGVMGERIRSHPWAETSLGDPRTWPQGLRTAVRIMLTTGHPTMILWGPELTCLYNDAFSRSLGPEKHPSILGTSGRQAWAEVWHLIGGQIEDVVQGRGAIWRENECVPIIRHGRLQPVYWTYSYSPIDEPSAPHGVGGVHVTCSETTEAVLAERKLTSEREQFVRLFDQAPIFLAVIEGPQHVFQLVNAAYSTLIDHRAVIGKPVSEALPEAARQGYVAILDEVYRSGKPYAASSAKYIPLNAHEKGEERYLDFVYQPVTDRQGAVTGILVQGVDVTARTLTDRALALSRGRLDYATRLSGVGFWYCDLPFAELEWDERVKDHFFFAPTARITIDDFYARIHPEDRKSTRDAIEASIRNRTPYDIVYRTVHPERGDVKWIRALGGTDYAPDGNPVHFDGVTVDVTSQKLDQERLALLNQQLREQDKRKDDFIATLAHELRNPLSPIRAAAKIVTSPNVSATQLKRAQNIIERQLNHMALLLDDLLDLARITQGKMRLNKTRVNLAEIIDAAIEAVSPAIEHNAQELVSHLPAEPIVLMGDPLRLSQVVSNLLTNAAKYSGRQARIALTCVVEGSSLAIAVKDNGIGIPREALGTIFEMFSQLDSKSDSPQSGLGIGLALVKGLTELHGGTVEARSEGRGHGSEFVVRFPLIEKAPERARGADEGTNEPQRQGRRILVVDDNADAAESLGMFLELQGHEVRVANLGRDALVVAEAFHPETILLDLGMPDMSGYQVARFLRREPWAKAIQLIALTGWGQESDRQNALEAGFDQHLVKPVDLDKLEELLRPVP